MGILKVPQSTTIRLLILPELSCEINQSLQCLDLYYDSFCWDLWDHTNELKNKQSAVRNHLIEQHDELMTLHKGLKCQEIIRRNYLIFEILSLIDAKQTVWFHLTLAIFNQFFKSLLLVFYFLVLALLNLVNFFFSAYCKLESSGPSKVRSKRLWLIERYYCNKRT